MDTGKRKVHLHQRIYLYLDAFHGRKLDLALLEKFFLLDQEFFASEIESDEGVRSRFTKGLGTRRGLPLPFHELKAETVEH